MRLKARRVRLMRLVNPQNEGQKKALVKVAERVLGREVKG
jgi:hypothetical protein